MNASNGHFQSSWFVVFLYALAMAWVEAAVNG
jgi:hypothetical protein